MQQLTIVKIGGNVIDNENDLSVFLTEFNLLEGKKILVHGGGKLANQLQEKLNMPVQLIDGRRITNEDTLKIVTMVYAGLINKNLVAKLQALKCNAIGLSGADGNCFLAHKRKIDSLDYGFVGDIDKINTAFISSCLENDLTPIFSAITHDGNGQLLNTNADTIASALAVALSAQYNVRLIYCFEKKGVLENIADDNSVIAMINKEKYVQLLLDKKLADGILPKIDNAYAAIDKGVKEVLIGDANDLLENITDKTIGTLKSH